MRHRLVMVKCPHKTGLCYETEDEKMLMNLPCPCNDTSVVVQRFSGWVRGGLAWKPEAIEKFLEDE